MPALFTGGERMYGRTAKATKLIQDAKKKEIADRINKGLDIKFKELKEAATTKS
jgi:hypothetical protein